MAGFGSLYSGIGLAQGLGGMSQAYAQGQQAAQQLAMQKTQQQMYLEQMQDSKLSRQVTLKNMQQKEQERQDALRRAERESKAYANLFGTPTPKASVKTPVDSLGAVTPSEGVTNKSLVPQEPIKTSLITSPSAMGAIPQGKTPIKSQFSALSMQPEVTQYETLKSQMQDIQSTLEDPNVSPEKKQEALRDFQYYAPQAPKVVEGYRNWAFKEVARAMIDLGPDVLERIKPIIKELSPQVGDLVLEKTPAIDDRGNEVKGKFAYNLLSSIKDENGISVLVPLDKRLLTTMDDPEKIEDVLSKIESARQQRINAFAVSEREIRRLEASQNQRDREFAKKLEDERLSMAPTWLAVIDSKGKIVKYEPILGLKSDLENSKMEQLRPKYPQLKRKDQDAAIEQDPEYISFKDRLVDNPRIK